MNKISWWNTEIGELEKEAVLTAFEKKAFSLGAMSKELEDKFAALLNVPYALLVPSGTAAITMALMSLGIEAGDEVILPDLGWIATANAAVILGAKVVLTDCSQCNPLIDPAGIERKLSSKTKAVIAVHLNGRTCKMKEIKQLTSQAGVALIEDACKALFSKSKDGYLGTLGDVGCFSLGLVSMISIGYGGLVVTKNRSLYEKMVLIRNQGVASYDNEAYAAKSFNFKVSDINSTVGLAQLTRLNDKLERVKQIYKRYEIGLAGLPFIKLIPVDLAVGEVPLLAEVRSAAAEKLISYLKQKGIEALKFHLPLHRAEYLSNKGDFPYASAFAKEGFVLPCGPAQPLDNIDVCIQTLKEWKG